MIFDLSDQQQRLKWAFSSCNNGAWGSEPDGNFDIVCIRAADFDGRLGRLNSNERTLRSVDQATYEKLALRPGDIILEKSGGGEKQLVGRAVIFEWDYPSITSNFLARCRPASGMEPAFINYLLLAIYNARGTFPHLKQSTGIQNLDLSSFLNIRVKIPPHDTQQRIAHFLDEKTSLIDALIEKKRVLLDRLAEKRQALITRAVSKGLNPDAPMKPSGIDWLGDIPAHWEILPLRRLRDYITSGSRGWAAYYSDDGDAFLRMTNVTGDGIEIDTSDLRFVDVGDISEGKRTSVQTGDILITITAELGSIAIVRQPVQGAFINQHLALLRVNQQKIIPEFLANFLTTDPAQVQFSLSGYGGTKQGLGFEEIEELRVMVPPREEQGEIARLCEIHRKTYRQLKTPIETSGNALWEYRSALITAAVTGQIAELR